MRKSFFIFIAFFLLVYYAYSQEQISSQKLINLRGEEISINTTKTNYFIVLSTQSCHECYCQTQRYLLIENYYTDTNKVVNVVIIDENISTVAIRKHYYNIAKDYFPQIQNIYYTDNIKKDEGILFGEKIDIRGIPMILIVQKDKILKYRYDKFINQ